MIESCVLALVVLIMVPLATSDMFVPLICNMNLDSSPCLPFSAQNYNLSETVEIPCGSCIEMDVAGNLTLEKGLDVQGKLVFPASRQSLKISTPFVFVQGAFVVEELADKMIPQPEKDLEFHFVGSEDVTFTSHHNQSFTKCESGCSMSKKPCIVAGGSLDIQGMHDECRTWSRLLSVQDAGSAAMNILTAPLPVANCSASLVKETFDDASSLKNTWDGRGAPSYAVENGYFSVSNRNSATEGPRVYLPFDCITPQQPYLLKFKFRYRRADANETSFVVPYIKLIRSKVAGGSDWISADEIWARGQMAAAPINEWHEYQTTIQFNEIMADPTETNALSLYIAPFSDVDIVDLDDFELTLAPSSHFEGRSCDSLLSADQSRGHIYPFFPTGGILTISEDDTGGHIFRSSLRSSVYSSLLSHDIAAECLAKAAVYSFSASVRVDSTEPREVSFALETTSSNTIAKCPPSSNNEWVVCSGNIQIREEILGADSPRLSTRVLDDSNSPVDVKDIKLEYSGGRVKQLVLEESAGVAGCWGPGAELLVTSHTILHQDSQVAKVESVSSDGVITLSEPIYRPITVSDDPMTAVEVALLTRNIRLTAADDDAENPLDGGHFMVMHTSAPAVQTIVGIESHGFGQQGKLGKYPLHFHLCDSVAGSLVSKCSIRNTKQRGIVVHGTNDLVLSQNILHNTRGHAVMLEDGGETGNTFEQNLGAVGLPVEIRISLDESDHHPSTFWITNPDNTWINNVAAGSEFSGFWFEVKTRVRGPSAAKYPNIVPNTLDLRKFIDNVSHSNAQGLQTYPQAGYRPDNQAVFQNHKSFRNRESGVFFHAGGRLTIEGGYLSDNKIGIDIDMDHSDVVSNTVVVGTSPAYQAIVKSQGLSAYSWPATSLCSEENRMIGIKLDSYFDGNLFGATGSSLSNVTFAGFGQSNCAGSSAINVDSEDVRYFDTRNRLDQVRILDDSPKVDLCGGEKQVAIRDVDGSCFGQPGYLISSSDAMLAHPDCSNVEEPSCAAFCPGVCLRTMTVAVPSTYERLALTLEVFGTLSDGRAINPIKVQDFQTKSIHNPLQESSEGKLFVTLPAGGNYTARFFMNDEAMWPVYADLRYEDEVNNCGPDFSSFTVDQVAQPACDQLIQNGEFEESVEKWWHIGRLGLVHGNDGANESTKSIIAPNAVADGGGNWVGVGQYLDTRCIEANYTYILSAQVKLTDAKTGAPFVCTIGSEVNDEHACPSAKLRFKNRLDNVITWHTVGKMLTADQEWNALEGSLVASESNAHANSAFVFINGAPAGVDIHVDQISLIRGMTTTGPTTSPTTNPTRLPTMIPTVSPTTIPTASHGDTDSVMDSLFEGSNADSITFNADSSMHLYTQNAEDSTVLTTKAHAGDLDLTVHFENRQISDSGYQPQVVLFFAPDTASVEDLTTNDSGFGSYFESTVIAWMREKVHCCMEHTWFLVKGRDINGEYVQYEKSKNVKMGSSGSLRLKRTNGIVSSSFSFDNGGHWTQIASDITLPEQYQTAPLKMGFRIKREWQSTYDLIARPILASGGKVGTSDAQGSSSTFSNGNTEQQSASCGIDGCSLNGPDKNAVVLSQDSYSGDFSFTVKVKSRDMFGTGYQAGVWLFFAPADATLADVPSSDNDFRSYAVAAVGDKIHASIDHTWCYASSQTESGRSDQNGGDGWKNVDGYLKLERANGEITSSLSSNGKGWKAIGVAKTLPASLTAGPLKLGLRTQRNWAPGYNIFVIPTLQ